MSPLHDCYTRQGQPVALRDELKTSPAQLARVKLWTIANYERAAESRRLWRVANRDRWNAARRAWRRRRRLSLGITDGNPTPRAIGCQAAGCPKPLGYRRNKFCDEHGLAYWGSRRRVA